MIVSKQYLLFYLIHEKEVHILRMINSHTDYLNHLDHLFQHIQTEKQALSPFIYCKLTEHEKAPFRVLSPKQLALILSSCRLHFLSSGYILTHNQNHILGDCFAFIHE